MSFNKQSLLSKKNDINIIYIIIESSEREGDSKRYLARLFKKEGYTVFLIMREAARFLNFLGLLNKNTLVIEKSSQNYQVKWFEKIKKTGAKLIVFEEEGWIPFDWKDFCTRRLNPATIEFIDEYWCSNQKQFSEVKKYFKNLNINLTGHPRWNLHEFIPPDENPIKKIFLFSSFGNLSSDTNFLEVMNVECGIHFNKSEYQKRRKIIKNRLKKFKKLLLKLTSDSEIKQEIILRFHPAEKNLYEANFLNKIKCSTEDLDKDLVKGNLIVHPGSTAALDASFKGLRSLYLDDGEDLSAAAKMICEVSSYEDALRKIKEILNKKKLVLDRSILLPFKLDLIQCTNSEFSLPNKFLIFSLNILKVYILFFSSINYKKYRRLKLKYDSFNNKIEKEGVKVLGYGLAE